MKIISIADSEEIKSIKQRSKKNFELALARVGPVIKEVRTFGDKALIDYTKKYDSVDISKNTIEVTKRDIEQAYKKVDQKTIKAIKQAKELIEKYAKLQLPKEWKKEIKKGIKVGQLVRPLDSVGCYVPGGNFPLPSTVLMTVVPAKVAGVKNIFVCTPPRVGSDAIFVAADIAGASKIFRIGGSQSIAALAYGTKTVPKVDKIVGPGNIFVTAAKKLVYGDVGIDFLAGPSEVLILAEKGNPEFIAADMLSQSEHDVLASSILITTKKELAEKVNQELEKQLKTLPTESIASEALRKQGAIILANSLDEAIKLANELAPEHLEIMVHNKEEIIPKLKNFGALFVGEYSPEAAGDYASGPNHVLPTSGVSKFRSGLSVLDFIKMPTIQELTEKGLNSIKDTVTTLAGIEGLEAHKRSVEVRCKK